LHDPIIAAGDVTNAAGPKTQPSPLNHRRWAMRLHRLCWSA